MSHNKTLGNNSARAGSFKSVFKIVLVLGVLFLIASYFIAMFLGPILFFFTPEGLATSTLNLKSFPIMLFAVIFLYIPVSINVGLLFCMLWGIYLICFFAAGKYRDDLLETVKNVFLRSPTYAFKNCLFAMPIISSVVLVSAVSITIFQAASGIPSGEPPLPENPFEAFILLTLAPLVEEIGFRLTPIGTFLVTYLFLHKGQKEMPISRMEQLKRFFVTFLYPDKAKKMFGTKNVGDSGIGAGISMGEWLIIVLTSISFGLAHILGGGWEVGKFASTSVQGFALGVSYLLYGIQGPILLHWFFNYYSYTFILSTEYFPTLTFISSLINVTTFIFGSLGMLALLVIVIVCIKNAYKKKITL
jgi:hypothetical protein